MEQSPKSVLCDALALLIFFADFHTLDCRPYDGCVKTSRYFLANIGEDLDAPGKAKLNLLTFVGIFDIDIILTLAGLNCL